MKVYDKLANFEIRILTSKISLLNSHDIDANIPKNVNCNYYTQNDFEKLAKKTQMEFQLFHININGLESNFENLHNLLAGMPCNFDIINITETSQSTVKEFKTNINVEGYESYFTPFKTLKGGTGIYIKKNYDSILREDLNISTQNGFESTWIEIKNKRSKNIICGCVYRHPKADMGEFIEYLDKCLSKIDNEKKEVFIAGDFNIDLLKLGSSPKYQDTYNTILVMVFLPQIINPTRIKVNPATIIDNILEHCQP